jgi:hypothetical protein
LHDISTNRDIIIGVDRYYELFMTRRENVSIPDPIALATARYLLQYYDIPKERLHIVTMDSRLREGARRAIRQGTIDTRRSGAAIAHRTSDAGSHRPVRRGSAR